MLEMYQHAKLLTFHDLYEVRSDASEQLSDRIVSGRSDPGLFEDLSAHVCVGDSEEELLPVAVPDGVAACLHRHL